MHISNRYRSIGIVTQNHISEINESVVEYIQRRENLVDHQKPFLIIASKILCSSEFDQFFKFKFYSFPLWLRDSRLCGILLHDIAFREGSPLAQFWPNCISSGLILPIQYYIVETEQDWQLLLKDPRNQLGVEILLAVVYNEHYLQRMKELTCSREWKRVPFFISKNSLQLLQHHFQDQLTSPLVRSAILKYAAYGRVELAKTWCQALDQSFFDKQLIGGRLSSILEFLFLKQIKRTGEVEKLYRYFIQNIDNPLSFLGEPFNNVK